MAAVLSMCIMSLEKSLYVALFVIIVSVKNGYAAAPGTFFWKPSLGLDLSVPSTEVPDTVAPTRTRIQNGEAVLINGYDLGMTIMAMASGLASAPVFPTLNPISADYHTNAYRWLLRHFSMLPMVLGGGKTYYETTQVWKRRFYFLDNFVPKFMRNVFPYVTKEDWAKEERDMKYFKRYAEAAFGKAYRYPNKRFNNFKSFETEESIDNLDLSSTSLTAEG